MRDFARYRTTALLDPDNFQGRYGWNRRHSKADVEAIWDEVVTLIPAGVTKVLEIGSGSGEFYKKFRAAHPGVDYLGIDLVPENVTSAQNLLVAEGTVTCATVAVSDTVTINGVTLTASGSQTASGLDFDETAGSDILVADSLVAAINDAGNGLSGTVVADNEGGTVAVVTIKAVAPGTGGNSLTLASSNGTTLAVSGATLTGGEDTSIFEIGSAEDTLMRDDADWDFVVSVNSLFADTLPGQLEALLKRLDFTSAKGFVVVGARNQLRRRYVPRMMQEVSANSTNETAIYYEGARGFLDDALLKTLHPIYIHRDDTTAVWRPVLPAKACFMASGEYNKMLMRHEYAYQVKRLSNPAPTDFTGVTVTGGRVTGRPTITVDNNDRVIKKLQ